MSGWRHVFVSVRARLLGSFLPSAALKILEVCKAHRSCKQVCKFSTGIQPQSAQNPDTQIVGTRLTVRGGPGFRRRYSGCAAGCGEGGSQPLGLAGGFWSLVFIAGDAGCMQANLRKGPLVQRLGLVNGGFLLCPLSGTSRLCCFWTGGSGFLCKRNKKGGAVSVFSRKSFPFLRFCAIIVGIC